MVILWYYNGIINGGETALLISHYLSEIFSKGQEKSHTAKEKNLVVWENTSYG